VHSSFFGFSKEILKEGVKKKERKGSYYRYFFLPFRKRRPEGKQKNGGSGKRILSWINNKRRGPRYGTFHKNKKKREMESKEGCPLIENI